MRSYSFLLLLVPALGGCNVATWGNLAVVAMTLIIFCGTLSLGRRVTLDDHRGEAPEQESVEG